MSAATTFWTDDTSVLFTSFYGWTPETWGTIGWTGDRGLARRNNLMKELTDPFITAVYVTSNSTYGDPDLKGRIAGFFLVTHETGDRQQFTHPTTHGRWPEKWQHSLRASRAFSYLPEYRLKVYDLDPTMLDRARHIAAMGEVLTAPKQIKLLRETPWVEVDVYTPTTHTAVDAVSLPGAGLVKAGPHNSGGYVVAESTNHAAWQLYVLQMQGDTNAYLGDDANGCSIYKIGLSVSPDMRRQAFEKAMPRGAFRWKVHNSTKKATLECFTSFAAAMNGEDAMKKHLASCAQWLGGEFYLASEAQINEAWQLGHAVANSCGE
jgi:hypothetical protein